MTATTTRTTYRVDNERVLIQGQCAGLVLVLFPDRRKLRGEHRDGVYMRRQLQWAWLPAWCVTREEQD
jgi:hypothetical protein